MSRTLGRKILTCIALISIIAQSFSPFAAILPQKAYAQAEGTASAGNATPTVDQTAPTDTLTPTIVQTPSDQTATPTPTVDQTQPIETVTPAPTDTPTDTLTPTPTDVPTDTITPTPTDNSPPSNNNSSSNNSNSSNDNQSQVQGDSTSVTPTISLTPTPEQTTGDEQLSMTILKNVSAPTIDLDMIVSEGSASLTTDKPDYAPTDTALITGSNLLPNSNYSLTISSTDNPATSTTINVTSDDKGLFAYAYQLDGNYRPNYKAELKDSTGTVVATTTFTDYPTVPVTTQPATGVTTTDATLNGTNGGSIATGHSFWVSLNTFSTASPTIPAGVYSTPDLGTITANTNFSASLMSITTTGVPTNLPAVTPNTTYYFAAWSLVSGTWQPGTIRTFTTLPGPVFIDTNTNGVLDPGEQSFLTIQAAINAATSGNTIVATAGTYNERIIIDKPLILTGVGQSIIDATSFGTVGNVVDITDLTGNTKIEGFDIKTGDYSNGIVSSGGTDASGTIEIKNNHIIGTNLTAAGDQFGIIAGYGDVRMLVISGNQISNTYNNSILVERQLGETEITSNILDGAFPSIFFMTYNGNDVTTLQKVNKNTIDMVSADPTWYGSAITFNSARRNDPSTSLGSGKYTNISIVDNIIKNLPATSYYNYKGIYLVNDDPAGTGGETTDAVISGNQISGATGNNAVGIKLSGKITGTVLSNNTIKDLSVGLLGTSNNNGAGTQYPSTTTFSDKNSLSGNTVGVNWPSQSSLLNATNNWWGNASGPYDNKTLPSTPNYNNPSGTGNSVSSNVDYKSWFTDSAMITLSSANPVTEAATDKTLTSATLNGTNGDYDASNASFWWGTTSAGPFTACTSCDSQLPSGWTHDTGLGAKTAGSSFNEPLTSLTPGTQYYFVAWSQVGGTWYPGNVLTFNTLSPDTTAPATPSLVSPVDGAYRHTSNSNKSDWTDVTDPSSPVVYYYESSLSNTTNSDGSFTSTAYQSSALTDSEIMNPGEPEVTYYWHVKACDAVGNCSAWSPAWQINIDNTDPTVPANGTPHNTTIATNNFDFNWDDSTDNSPITYRYQASQNPTNSGGVLTNGLWTSGTLPTSMIHSSGAGDGTWYWQVKAVDAAGNESAWSPIWNVTLDTVAPTATINYSTTAPTNGNVTATLNPSEPVTVTNNGSSTNYTFTNNGSFTFEFRDAAGNTGSATATVANIDKTAPTTPGQIGWSTENPPVGSDYTSGTDFNNYRTCGQSLNYSPMTNLWGPSTDANGVVGYDREVYSPKGTLIDSSSLSTNYVNGGGATNGSTYWVRVRAYDAAGNKSDWTPKCAITYDTTAPTVTSVNSDGKTFNIADMPNKTIKVTFNEDIANVPTIDVYTVVGNQVVNNCGDSNAKTFCFSYTLPAPDQELHTIYISGAQDLAGNTMTTDSSHAFKVDTIAPTTTDDTDGAWHNSSVTVNLTCNDGTGSGCAHTYYTTNGSKPTTNSPSGNSFTLSSDGIYTIKYFSIDNTGNQESVKTAANKVKIDKTAPILNSQTPFSGWYTTNQTSTFSYVDSLSGIASGNPASCVIKTQGANQTCSVTPNVCDAAGNCNTIPVTSNGAHIDKTNPTNLWITQLDGDYVKGVVNLSVDASDTISGIDFVRFRYGVDTNHLKTIIEDTDSPYETTWDTTGLSDGSYVLRARAEDNAGRSNIQDIKVIVDNTAPATPSATPGAGNYTSDQLVTLSSSDSGSGLKEIYYTTNGTDPATSGTRISYSLDDSAPITIDHDMTIKAIAYDNAGNTSDVLEAIYTINIPSSGGPGDGRSDGKSDGSSSCPSCTQAPTLQGSVLGLATGLGGVQTEVLGAQTQPEVLGAATNSATPTPSISPTPAGKTLVSSSANWVLNHLMLSFVILIILAAITYFIYRKKRKK